MADKLYSALEVLRPKDFLDIPLDDLATYLPEIFSKAELIANSVPPPANEKYSSDASLTLTSPNVASCASEMVHSSVLPPRPDSEYEALWKHWGKPVKVAQSSNPLGISVYKMAGHDRHGAWFARRSVHEGLGFVRWKHAMQREFPESLAVTGGPGAGSVRGIGADRRVERRVVPGAGRMEVYHLSAQFPGPVAPREFVTLLLTTDSGLSEKSVEDKDRNIPRHYMVVSIPVDHPDTPPRNGMVRGAYESVELIREVPTAPRRSASMTNLLDPGVNRSESNRSRSRQRGSTISFAESRGISAKGERIDKIDEDPETNPVEWIMITRSDPGGGIPRFMVERNTPASITADAVKFIEWATKHGDEIPDEDEDIDKQDESQKLVEGKVVGSEEGVTEQPLGPLDSRSTTSTFEPSTPGATGIIASLTNAVASGIETYAPPAVTDNLPVSLLPHHTPGEYHSDDESTETSSLSSFASARQFHTAEDLHPGADASLSSTGASGDPLASSPCLTLPAEGETMSQKDKDERKKQTQAEKELDKLDAKRKALDQQYTKQIEQQQAKSATISEKATREQEKLRTRHEKDIKKAQERHEKELRKLEQRRQKEAKRVEDQKRKEADKDAISKANRERDEAKDKVERLEKENAALKDQVGELQREVTMLVREMGRLEGGGEVMKKVTDEIKRSKSPVPSMKSAGSAGRKSTRSEKSGRSAGVDC
jgi:Protein of unknown function (DUF3074)